MRTGYAVILAAALTGCQTVPAPPPSQAAVTEALNAWADAFNACDAPRAAALYDAEPMLWGTVSTTLITTRAGVQAYFERACAANPPPKVLLGEGTVRVHGDTAVSAGRYVFVVTAGGQPRQLPARYSVTWRRTGGGWRIIEHHSSALPAAPSDR